jgi:transposase InsO family protein
MVLGKVERFWETIWQKFLSRSQFDSFEAARKRIKLWIKHYNHKRPHQGIEGLCQADRFAELGKSFLRHNTSIHNIKGQGRIH